MDVYLFIDLGSQAIALGTVQRLAEQMKRGKRGNSTDCTIRYFRIDHIY